MCFPALQRTVELAQPRYGNDKRDSFADVFNSLYSLDINFPSASTLLDAFNSLYSVDANLPSTNKESFYDIRSLRYAKVSVLSTTFYHIHLSHSS